jgi:hypothetical protein
MSRKIVTNKHTFKPKLMSHAVYCISTDVPESPLGTGKSLFKSAINLLNSEISK